MSKKDNDTQGDYSAFDSQWDVIKQCSAEEFIEAKNKLNQPALAGINNKNTESFYKDSSGRFLPPIDDQATPNQTYLELFKQEIGSSTKEEKHTAALSKRDIDVIAQAIVDLGSSASSRSQPAGYTYLAQFLTHDIVPSTSLLRTRNTSLNLNLDSLYFPYIKANKWGCVSDCGKFELENGGTDFYRVEWTPKQLRELDISIKIPDSREEHYYFAVTPEHRNDGNVILSQLTVLFQRAHNYIVEELVDHNRNTEKSPKSEAQYKTPRTGEDYYNKAREILTLLFQKIIVHDLLKVTLDHDTYDYYFAHRGPSLFEGLEGQHKVPKEFTHAVSRYAHSMIRSSYTLRENGPPIKIEELFRKNRRLADAVDTNLEKRNLKIEEWGHFFAKDWSCTRILNTANSINLKRPTLSISEGPIDKNSQAVNAAKNLATFDIKASSELCTYNMVKKNENVREFLKRVKHIYPETIDLEYFSKINYESINEQLKNTSLYLSNDNAPFLVSMALEAYAMPSMAMKVGLKSEPHDQDRLGIVGSIIYAETIRESIRNNENLNIYKKNDELKRELAWAFPVYQSLLNSFDSFNMMELSNLITLNKTDGEHSND